MRISVCIPQYNRSAYLLKGLESIRQQTHADVEVIVADDCSTDDTAQVIPPYLEQSGLRYRYFRHAKNLGYDANLRSAMRAASGDYLIVMGNDDALPDPETLSELAALLEHHDRPAIAIGNFYSGAVGQELSDRARATENLGHGVDVALRMFRAFSCVTALVFERDAYLAADTNKYDGSIYVQMYLGARIIASGGNLLMVQRPLAVTGLTVDGKQANAFADRLHEFRWRFRPALGGLDQVGRVVCDAVQPFVEVHQRQAVARKVFQQLLSYSYPFFLYDYRRRGQFWASLNLAFGCFPPSLTRHVPTSPNTLLRLFVVYLSSTSAGLLMPMPLLEPVKEIVRWTSRRFR